DAFGDYIPPSTSVVMERCFGGGSTISTSLIAVVPEAGYEINKIYPPGVASSPTSGFVPAVICNEFVFVAGQMAHNPGTGLDPRVIVPEHAAWAGTPIRQQTEFLIAEKLKRGHPKDLDPGVGQVGNRQEHEPFAVDLSRACRT